MPSDKADITDAGSRLRQMNDALEENDRLQAEIARLRSQPCPYVTGNATRYCTLTPLTLTDAEREAVALMAEVAADPRGGAVLSGYEVAATLRGLLDRLSPVATPETPCTPGEGTRQAGCTLTDEEREAILYCVSCAQDYRDRLDGSDDRATQMIEIAMRLAVGPAPVEGPRTASVTDVGGAGPTITHAEREALEIAVEYVGSAYAVHHHAATLRGLLERTT